LNAMNQVHGIQIESRPFRPALLSSASIGIPQHP